MNALFILIKIIPAIAFAICLNTTVGPDDLPGAVPLRYGVAVYLTASWHGLDVYDAGALLLAEHRGRDYDPLLEGQYNGGGEIGLFQLKQVWARETTERCKADVRGGHHRYHGLKDCLWIDSEAIVTHKPRPRSKRRRAHLGEALTNIEAGVIAFLYIQAKHKERGFNHVTDWRGLFRCSRAVWGPRPLKTRGAIERHAKAVRRCASSVARVEAWKVLISPRSTLTLRSQRSAQRRRTLKE